MFDRIEKPIRAMGMGDLFNFKLLVDFTANSRETKSRVYRP